MADEKGVIDPKEAEDSSGFMEWISALPQPHSDRMPLTHITNGPGAERIVNDGSFVAKMCNVFRKDLVYFFYGRPAYRLSAEGSLRREAFGPFCFIMKPSLLDKASALFAFDTGAFDKRMKPEVFTENMNLEDFKLKNAWAVDQLVCGVFGSQEAYFDGARENVELVSARLDPSFFTVRAYLDIILSPGRNEPDDRIHTVEAQFDANVCLEEGLMAVVMPHTIVKSSGGGARWVRLLKERGVSILPYDFHPGRHPEHYYTLLEKVVLDFYRRQGIL